MLKRKKFKFYFHNSAFLKLSEGPVRKSVPWKKLILWPARAAFVLSYWVGYILYEFSRMAKQFSVSDWQNTVKSAKLRTKIFSSSKPVMNFAVFLIILLVPLGLIESFRLAAKALETKEKVNKFTIAGLAQFQEAKNNLSEQDFKAAGDSFSLAQKSFSTGKKELEQTGDLLGGLVNLAPMKQQADLLIETATEAAKIGSEFSVFAEQMDMLKMTPAGFSPQGNLSFSEIMDRMEASVSKIDIGINRITDNLQKIDAKSLPQEYQQSFTEKFQSLNALSSNFKNLKSIFEIFKKTFSGNSRVLILMQNNNELRPTGGFIGSFASLSLKEGSIESLKVDSVYALDGQLQESITPPQPILNVNQRWYLRDANWFADFPQSAKKLSAFYEKEGGETPDIIMTMTPNLIIDLIRLTGPVELPKYQVTLTPENFVELTQVISSDYTDMPENKPKQILADLVPVLFDRLSKLTDEQKGTFLEMLQKNLNEKQVMFYAQNAQLQSLYQAFNWAGKILSSDRDYLSIFSANLEATKSDLFIDQSAKLVTKIGLDGTITNRLTLTRHNRLPKIDKTYNNSFIRVLVPKGSRLLENQGFDFKVLDAEKPVNQKIDDDVLAWEKSAVRDLVSGTTIGEESGKTFFGNWQKLEGGETREITLVYQLPYKLKDTDRYSLLLQKQPGIGNMPFTHEVNFEDRRLEWSSFEPQDLTANSYVKNLELNRDQILGVVFVRR